MKETEKEYAIKLANKIMLDCYVDPDGDLAVLARQLLRALERLGEIRTGIADSDVNTFSK